MALDTGKKTVKIKNTNTQVPQIKTKSNLSIIADAFEPAINQFTKNAEATAQANYFQNFSITTRDAFAKFKEDHANNPDEMKSVVDSYSKSMLAEVPPAFKIQANAMLASYSSNSVLYASNNFTENESNKAEFKNNESWKSLNTTYEFDMNTAANIPDVNTAKGAVNDKAAEALLEVNEHWMNDQITFVNTFKRTEKQQMKVVRDNVEAIAVSNGVHMMMAHKDTALALKWLGELEQGNNPTPINAKELKDNPVMKVYNDLFKDDDDRKRIIKSILDKYKFINRDKFNKKKVSHNQKQWNEPHGLLSWEQDQNGTRNGHDVAMSVDGMEIGSGAYNNIIEKVAYNTKIQENITEFMQSGKLIDFDNDQEKKDTASAILANFGVHDIQMGLTKDGKFTDSFIDATNLLSELNIFPDEFSKYLEVDAAGSFDKPEVLAQLREKILTYNYLTSDKVFPNWAGGDKFLKWAAEQGIESRNDVVAADILNKYNNIDWDKRFDAVSVNFQEGKNKTKILWWNFDLYGSDKIDNQIRKDLHSPHFFLKFFMDEKNQYHKHLLAENNQTTWLESDASKIIPAHAKAQLETFFITELSLIAKSDDIDVWSKENKGLRSKAWKRTLQRLKDENWGIETHTDDGVPKLVKNPYWLNKGSFNNNDVYAAFNKDFHLLDKDEQLAKWGTNNWEEVVNNYFKPYADNSQGDVKISLDKTNTLIGGSMGYNLSINKGGDVITLSEPFEPHGWANVIDKDQPSSAAQVTNHAADLMFKEFQKTDLYKNLDHDKSLKAEKFIYGTMRQGLKLGDWRWYPDFPGFNDTPAELRPFHFIARALGHDGDLREMRTTFETMNTIASESLSFVKKINSNRRITNTEKAVEALFPPEKMPYTKNNMDLTYRTWVEQNYQDESKALTHRTNNWMAVSSSDWDGEMDVNYNRDSRKFAVFGHPANSVRAAVKSIINHSTLTAKINDVDIRYSEEPTIKDILSMYAQDTESYLKALDKYTDFEATDTIDLLDANQMHKLLKFIMKHEMGVEYYNNTFGTSNRYVDAVLIEGYQKAINSYNGELGKL